MGTNGNSSNLRINSVTDSNRTDYSETVSGMTFRTCFDLSHGISKADLEANPNASNVPLKINVSCRRHPNSRSRREPSGAAFPEGRNLSWGLPSTWLHIIGFLPFKGTLAAKRERGKPRGEQEGPKGNAAVRHSPPLFVGPANGAQRAELPEPAI